MKIDAEFHGLIPPLATEEYRQLEASLLAWGCRDALLVWLEEDLLLDGHNRYEICQKHGLPYETRMVQLPDREAAKDWIESNQLGRRNLTPENFKLLLGDLYNRAKKAVGKPLGTILGQNAPISTAEVLAKRHGVSPATVKRAGKFAEEVAESPELKAAIFKKQRTAPIKKQAKQKQEQEHLEATYAEISEARKIDISKVCDIRCCEAGLLLASGIKPDIVITDPPYPKEYLHLFNGLAEACKHAEIPVVAVMCGQSYLPEIFAMMCRHLKYRWTMAYMTPGPSCKVWQPNVNTNWKPVIVFGDTTENLLDVANSEAYDKRFHGWGQSESGMADLVEKLTKPGQLVCDPFLGAGTTALVCLRLGRRFVGCDIDQACVDKALMRCVNDTGKE